MANQTIGKIKVVVNNQGLGPINVKQSNQLESKIRTISYGQPLELHNAVDLQIGQGANTGDAIIYDSNTGIFKVSTITSTNAAYANVANTVLEVFGGTF